MQIQRKIKKSRFLSIQREKNVEKKIGNETRRQKVHRASIREKSVACRKFVSGTIDEIYGVGKNEDKKGKIK